MASRTKQKEQARARRLEEERTRLERERQQRRLRMLGGVILGALAVVAVAIAISGGGGHSTTGLVGGGKATRLAAQVNNQFSGIPQSGATLGSSTAPVTMIYYGDLECPVCQDFTLNGGFPGLVAKDVRAGRVKIVYRSFQTATPSADTFRTQQAAALAAGRQNLFWQYTDLFYHQQGAEGSGYVTDSFLSGLAREVPGLNVSAWQSARSDPALLNQVTSDEAAGSAAGVRGTPTLIFQGPKGEAQPPSTVPSYSELEQTVRRVA